MKVRWAPRTGRPQARCDQARLGPTPPSRPRFSVNVVPPPRRGRSESAFRAVRTSLNYDRGDIAIQVRVFESHDYVRKKTMSGGSLIAFAAANPKHAMAPLDHAFYRLRKSPMKSSAPPQGEREVFAS
jgi:hypothetical protein